MFEFLGETAASFLLELSCVYTRASFVTRCMSARTIARSILPPLDVFTDSFYFFPPPSAPGVSSLLSTPRLARLPPHFLLRTPTWAF